MSEHASNTNCCLLPQKTNVSIKFLSQQEILAVRAQGRIKMAELLEAKELDATLKNNNVEAQAKAEETHRKLNMLRNEDQSVQRDVHELENEVKISQMQPL